MAQPSSRPPEVTYSRGTFTFDRPLTDIDIEKLKSRFDASEAVRVPAAVKAAYTRAVEVGFDVSSTPEVGQLLSVLTAAVPTRGRVLELGTGVGAGLGWIVHGLGTRNDVEVISVELDSERAELVRAAGWPEWVSVIVGDCWQLIKSLGYFDLIFVDILGRETYDLGGPIAAIRPGGVLIIDDIHHACGERPERRARLSSVRDQLFGNPHLFCADLAFSSGVLLAVRHR